jgi:hypothetical protein
LHAGPLLLRLHLYENSLVKKMGMTIVEKFSTQQTVRVIEAYGNLGAVNRAISLVRTSPA